MKVLVTGAGALLGQGIIKSLRMASTQYEIVAVDPDPRAVGLYWADRSYLVPLAAESDYLERITTIIAVEKPDAVLVGTDVELITFAVNKSEIEAEYDTKIIVSPPEVIRIADDKWHTYEFLATNGFPHPRSALPNNVSDLLNQCDFPLIVKPRTGARSVGVQTVKSERDLEAALARITNPIIQECVSTANNEFTSGVTVIGEHAKAIVTMHRDLRDGNTYRAYVQPVSPFNDVILKIAEKLGGMGPLNFQFRADSDLPKVFEINARFSGTTPFRAYAGFNEVDAIVRHIVLGDPVSQPTLRPIVILRYWDEVIIEADQVAIFSNTHSLPNPKFEKHSQL